jgi:Uma2 family endonuclease
MSTAERATRYTFEEFCWIIPDKQKADLIDGVIYVASPDNTDANDLNVWLMTLLYLFVSRKKLGKVYVSRVAYRLDDHNGPEPDIGFVRKARQHLIRRGHVAGAPDLAMEIVSRESEERDYHKKRKQYEEAGVREYWIIDEIRQTVLLLRLDRNGKYREVKPRMGVLHSQVITGFWLDPKWLWQKPFPDVGDLWELLTSGNAS